MKRLILLLLVLCLVLPTVALAASEYPGVKFYAKNYVASTGNETRVKVLISRSGATAQVIELRNDKGEVLATRNYKPGATEYNFAFTPTESQEGGHNLSVWCGDTKISSDEAYLAITDSHRKVITKIENDQKYMCITVDCAYVGGPTDEFLAVMDKYGIKCTFFMTGQFVQNFTEEAKKIRDAGHEIGNHSFSHPHMTDQDNLDSWAYQVRHTAEIIREELGVNPRFFRPPFGEFNWKISAFARSEGMEVCLWTADSHDWDTKFIHEPEKVIKRVTETKGDSRVDSGMIVLFHLDGYNTPSILDQVIPYYQSLGYTLVTVSELCAAGGRVLPACPYEEAE